MATMTIEDYKKQYEAAKAAGDAAGMQAANDGANAIRAAQGVAAEYATEDIAKVAAQSSIPPAPSDNSATKAPTGYTGSSQQVSTYTGDQDAIKAKMNANSLAWYGASAEEQARLHAENEYLASLLGDGVTFDPSTGYWSGAAAQNTANSKSDGSSGSSLTVPQGSDLTGQVEDYSSYLEQMYAAQKEKALAELEAAYQSNLAALDRAGAGVAEQYQAARNSTVGDSELAKRNFAEYAAAAGLNSGTGGQAELARNVTLQNNLNGINTAEADTVADLELQRANAEIEYNGAIAQAEAEGDYQLAAALYQEKVRVQNALIDLEIQQQQMDLQRYQLEYQAQRDQVSDQQYADQFAYQQQRDQVSDSQWQQSFDLSKQQFDDSFAFQQQQYADSLAQQQQSVLADYGSAFLQQGIMPSAEMLAAMGITQADAQNYITALKSQVVPVSSSGSGGSGNSGTTMTLTTAKQYASNGIFNDDVLAAFYKNGWNDELLAAEYGYTGSSSSPANSSENLPVVTNSGSNNTGYNDAYFTAMARSIAAGLEQGKAESVVNGLDGVWSKLSPTQKQTIQALLGRYGYQYTEG